MTNGMIYILQIIVMLVTLGMIVTARRSFNGFAMTFVALGLMLIVMRIDKATGLIGEPGMSIETSLAVAFFCYQAWSIFKDRRDHAEYMNWREKWADELKALRAWQERKRYLERREQELEQLREPSELRSTWDIQWPLAAKTRNVTMKKQGSKQGYN